MSKTKVEKKEKKIKKEGSYSSKTTFKSKKKVQKKFPKGIVSGKFSFNNTILTLSRENGDVLKQISSGSIGFKNTKKSTPYAAQKCAESMARVIFEDYGMGQIELCAKGIGAGRDVVIRRMLGDSNFSIVALSDKTPIAYGGCRPRKSPRK